MVGFFLFMKNEFEYQKTLFNKWMDVVMEEKENKNSFTKNDIFTYVSITEQPPSNSMKTFNSMETFHYRIISDLTLSPLYLRCVMTRWDPLML